MQVVTILEQSDKGLQSSWEFGERVSRLDSRIFLENLTRWFPEAFSRSVEQRRE